MIASFLGNCWHGIYPTWRTTTKARKPHIKKFPENWKPFAFQGFEGFSDLRTSFLSRFTSGQVFFKGFWLIELHVCLLPSNHFLKTSISKRFFGLLCPLWRCGCVSMKWMSQSCHPRHQAVEHTRWPTPPYGVWQERKACEGRHAMPRCELQNPEKRTKGIRLAVCFFLCFLCACVCILLGQGGLCLFMHLWVWDALRVYLEGCTLGKERIDCDTLLLPCFGGGSILNALWMAVHCSSLWTRFLHCTRIVSCSKDEMVYDLMNVRASQSDFGWAKLEIWRFL